MYCSVEFVCNAQCAVTAKQAVGLANAMYPSLGVQLFAGMDWCIGPGANQSSAPTTNVLAAVEAQVGAVRSVLTKGI